MAAPTTDNHTMMMMRRTTLAYALATELLAGAPTAVFAQPNCRNSGSFERWPARLNSEGAAPKNFASALATAAPHIVLVPWLIGLHRGQRFFPPPVLVQLGR